MPHLCRYCCKSPKLPGANFPAVKKSDRRPLICVPSIALPRSSASLASGDEVPHIFTRKSRLKPGKFLITSAKRLLQQNLPTAVVSRRNKLRGQNCGLSLRHLSDAWGAASLRLCRLSHDNKRSPQPRVSFGIGIRRIDHRQYRLSQRLSMRKLWIGGICAEHADHQSCRGLIVHAPMRNDECFCPGIE